MMETNKKNVLERNHAIDLMKFFAAILITNSHMVDIYPDGLKSLAFGGAIGDSLFFFCAGFLLLYGRPGSSFLNWYKRRINRIFPTIFAVALLSIIIFGENPTLKGVIVDGGGWFVQAIFLFYAIFYFIKKYLYNKLWIPIAIDIVIILIWFLFFWDYEDFIFGGLLYMRFPVFFLMMLFGAYMGRLVKNCSVQTEKPLWLVFTALFGSVFFYYGFIYAEKIFPVLNKLQILLVPVHILITYSFFIFCSNLKVLNIYKNKYLYWFFYGFSACCLEVYLTGGWSFRIGSSLNNLFPFNLVVLLLSIFAIAYLVKIFGNFLSQTFKSEDYDWKKIVKL